MTVEDVPAQHRPDKEPDRRLVVGVDGSDASVAALRWAVRHAASADGCVVAVYVCPPAVASGAAANDDSRSRDREDLVGTAQRELDRAVRRTVEPPKGAEVARCVIASPHAAEGLIGATKRKDMLVIGAPQSEPNKPAAGSTVQQVLLGSSCPVILVPSNAPSQGLF